MKLVFICSPYGGDVQRNVLRARIACRDLIVQCGSSFNPIAPHLLYPQFLDDALPTERAMGLARSMNLLSKCDHLYVVGENRTPGMVVEISMACALGISFSIITDPLDHMTPEEIDTAIANEPSWPPLHSENEGESES